MTGAEHHLRALVAAACKTIGSQWLQANPDRRVDLVIHRERTRELRTTMHGAVALLHRQPVHRPRTEEAL